MAEAATTPKKPRASRAKKLVPDDLMAIPEVEEAIRYRLPVLIQRMFDLAEGVVMMETRTDKESGELIQRIYQMAPDRQALQFLIENVIGKTPQRIEMTGKGGGPISVTPWMPLDDMAGAGMLPEGDTVEDGVYTYAGDKAKLLASGRGDDGPAQ